MADFGTGAVHAGLDHFGGIGSAPGQAAAQLVDAGRQQEHADDVGFHLLIKLLRALPVDIEQEILALADTGFHLRLGGAVAVAEHGCPLEELPVLHHPVKFGLAGEDVILPVHFTGTRRAGGDGYRHADFRVMGQQLARNRGLACAGRRGQDEHQAAALKGIG